MLIAVCQQLYMCSLVAILYLYSLPQYGIISLKANNLKQIEIKSQTWAEDTS